MATDKATLSVLNTFADLLDGSDGTVSPAVMAFFPTVVEVCRAASTGIAEDIVEVLESMARIPACRSIMQSEGARELLEDIAERSVSRSLGLRITAVIAEMDGQAADPTPVASSSSGKTAIAAKTAPTAAAAGRVAPVVASVPATTRRELQTLQLNMDNLLGCREQEDQYIRALLLLDGVTSVTLDRKREVAVVFAYDAGIKAQLYAAVQETCDEIQDAAGKPRFVVRGEHAAYLEDDDAEDFFAPGAKHALTKAGGARTGASESIADRIRRRDEAEAAKAGGWLSWLKW